MTVDLPLSRRVAGGLLALSVGAVALALGTTVVGGTPGPAVVAGSVLAPFALVVVVLVAVGREVASQVDDHDEIETRVAEGLGMSKAEFDDRLDRSERTDTDRPVHDLEEELRGPPFDE